MTKSNPDIWRQHMLDIVEPYKDAPLLLSGGMDSGTILAAQLALGGKPQCYTFQLENFQSKDYKVARSMCHHYKLTLHCVEIPRDKLLDDVIKIITTFKTTKKTHIQCIHPMLYIADMMAEDAVSQCLIGTGGIVEDNRKCAVALHKHGEDAARKIRRENLLNTTGSATEKMHDTLKRVGIRPIEPYSVQPFADWHLSLDIAEINTPRQKGIALRAFPEFWRNNWWRPNSGLQMGTGIRRWHDTLLQTDNPKHYKSVVGIYNELGRQYAK